MNLISHELLREIDQSKKRLDKSKVTNYLEEMFRHLEEETIHNVSIQDKDNQARKNEVISNFRKAWKYSEDNFHGPFNLMHLTDIAARVEPCLKIPGRDYADFRKGVVGFPCGYVPPADGERIRVHLERMLETSKNEKMHPVESAVYHYFHLSRIQPLENGNKRTANIIMNSILREGGYLPVSIALEQTGQLERYFVGALRGFREMDSKNKVDKLFAYKNADIKQSQFFDFLARIELTELKCSENRLAGLHHYEINYETKDNAAAYTLKHKLRNYFKSQGMLGQVKLNERKRRIEVTGEIPYHQLERSVKDVHGIRRFEIKTVD